VSDIFPGAFSQAAAVSSSRAAAAFDSRFLSGIGQPVTGLFKGCFSDLDAKQARGNNSGFYTSMAAQWRQAMLATQGAHKLGFSMEKKSVSEAR
jgi:hypothetical protein